MTSVNLRPTMLDLNLYQGDAWSVQLTVRAPAVAGIVGALVDLTGYTIFGNIVGANDTIIPLNIAPTDLPNGVIHFGQNAAGVTGRYDVQLTPPSGLPRTYLYGLAVVADGVTP